MFTLFYRWNRIPTLAALAALLVLIVPAALAQDAESERPRILFCGEGGCRYSPASGEFTTGEIEVLFGEEDPHGNNTVVCLEGGECSWSALTPEDADLANGGDGEPEGEHQMVFDEDEVDPVDEDSDEMLELDIEDIDEIGDEQLWEMIVGGDGTFLQTPIVPQEGAWNAFHYPGQMVCPGLMTMDIPGGDETSGNIVVSEDGSELTMEALDPELANVPMRRVGPALFLGQIDINADGGTMTLNFITAFLDPSFALGLIYAELEQQGTTCTITRRFMAQGSGETAEAESTEEE